MVVSGSYASAPVVLSVVVAIVASYTALDLGNRIRAAGDGWARRTWLGAAAVTMGGGIWSMHFVAMLAFSLPSMPIAYDIGLTLLSLALPIAVTAIAFQVVNRTSSTRLPAIIVSGIVMGLGIVAMHYTGMAAMRMPAHLGYDPSLVAASVLIAVGASTVALWLAFRTQSLGQKLASAVVMGLAIAGMHYTAMAAARFTAHLEIAEAQSPVGLDTLEQTSLALGITIITLLILGLGLIAAFFDRRFAVLAEREAEALRRSEERYRSLYDRAPVPLHSLDAEGRVVHVNTQWLDLLGYTREEVIGRPVTAFQTDESARRMREVYWPEFMVRQEITGAELQFRQKSGEVVDVCLSSRVVPSPHTGVVETYSVLVDVTAQRRAEAALRQAQKMEAVGQLTGGIAHDFNNILTVVIGYLDDLVPHLTGAQQSAASAALLGAIRAADLTRRLLAFGRRQMLRPAGTNANQLISHMSELLRRTLGENIAIQTVLAAGIWPCFIDPTELETALLNLAINARDAMLSGGTLTIQTANMHFDDSYASRYDGVTPGEYVMIAVSDTGIGIPKEKREKVFEPFFTTKEIGKGSGLGLAQVYGFVKQSGGQVTLYSEVGVGTTVRLYLPRHALPEVVGPSAETRRREMPVARCQEVVLVVEDDVTVRGFSARALRDLGYCVLEAEDAAAALRVTDAHPEIDLLFTDVGLPGMNGRGLADAVTARRPALKVLYTTGYAGEALTADGTLGTNVSVLQKPFTREELAMRVRAALDSYTPV